MKVFKIMITLLIVLSLFLGCKKEQETTDEDNQEKATVENVTQYLKDYGYWVFKFQEDIGKKAKDVKEKEYFEFGSKFTVIKSIIHNEKEYYNIQLPDKSEYWIPKKALAEKFVVINQADVSTYNQPDPDYISTIKVQPGDYGIFLKEMDGWINVDFYAYRPRKKDGEKKWVGNLWIKEGYTNNLQSSKEAYYLYLAYHRVIKENNIEKAINDLKKALEVNAGIETETTYIVKDYLNELSSQENNAELTD